MDEPQKHYVNEVRYIRVCYMILLYEIYKKGKTIENESRSVVG